MTTRTWLANGIEGRHVLAVLIGFFGVMVAANAVFVYFAVATHSGGDTSKPYQKGLAYNRTIEADLRQAGLGWRTELAYDDDSGRLDLSFLDQAAMPVTGLRVGARLARPATDKDDRRVTFTEASPGVYAAIVHLAPGLWILSIASRGRGDREGVYRLKRRLFVAEKP
jgi:nitrogen fixation protein FixH